MTRGSRGFQKGDSLAQFIAREFKIPNHRSSKPLTGEIIKNWVDQFIQKHERKPTRNDGVIEFAENDYKNTKWTTVDSSLKNGRRGLPGESSLAEFIKEHFGIKNRNYPPEISIDQVCVWIQKYIDMNGKKPTVKSGPIKFAEGPHEGITWAAVNSALQGSRRGLSGRISLPQLIEKRFEIKRSGNPPPLSESIILIWVRKYIEKYGKKPTAKSGSIEFAKGKYKRETWLAVDAALRRGTRSLTAQSSLANLIHDKLGLKNHLKG